MTCIALHALWFKQVNFHQMTSNVIDLCNYIFWSDPFLIMENQNEWSVVKTESWLENIRKWTLYV